jgi:hypothetical protein
MSEIAANRLKRHRGVALQFIYTNHHQQLSHMDDLQLWGLFIDLGYTVGQNEVLTLVQELRDRGYLTIVEKVNRITGRVEISRIQITPSGRDLVERTQEDRAVLIP